MRSSIEFFMDKEDEKEFISFVLSFPNTCLIPHFSKSKEFPQITNIDDLRKEEWIYFIWNKEILSKLDLEPTLSRPGEFTFATVHSLIQFIRSRPQDSALESGRIALATTDLLGKFYNKPTSKNIEGFYNNLRNWIKKRYNNKLLVYHIGHPEESQPINRFWLGKHAEQQLRSKKTLKLKQPGVKNIAFSLA